MQRILTSTELVSRSHTYDIIVGDFGRAAAVEYITLFSCYEKQAVERILAPAGLPFHDEYRRVMFSLVCDVAYAKRPILDSAAELGILPEKILLGVGGAPIPRWFLERVAILTIQEAMSASTRGYQRLRVGVICNGFTAVLPLIADLLSSQQELLEAFRRHDLKLHDVDALDDMQVEYHGIPNAVVSALYESLHRRGVETPKLLTLGAVGVRRLYSEIGGTVGFDAIDVSDEEQSFIDDAIIAAVAGDGPRLEYSSHWLKTRLIDRVSSNDDVVVIEGCTDFKLGLGISSLDTFSRHMVNSCYGADYISEI